MVSTDVLILFEVPAKDNNTGTEIHIAEDPHSVDFAHGRADSI